MYETSGVELLTWSFISKLKLGPLSLMVLSNITWVVSKVTWYAWGEFIDVTTHNWELIVYCCGSGSYNLTKTLESESNLMLLAMNKILSPKFK